MRAVFDFEKSCEQLAEIELELSSHSFWSDENKNKIIELEKKLNLLNKFVPDLKQTIIKLSDISAILAIVESGHDVDDLKLMLDEIQVVIDRLKLIKTSDNQQENNDCLIEIHSGAGGIESQSWAAMVLKMYLNFCESKKWHAELVDVSYNSNTGIKNATIKVSGGCAYELLKTESGIHRMVRKSPFDPSGKRHTSFCSVFVSKDVSDEIIIEINKNDLKIDTYRSSGPGGQHVNKTDSAVRITHIPTNTVVSCQIERSQQLNRERALKMLKSKLYNLKLIEINDLKSEIENGKSDICWGNQIRNYVLDKGFVKDLRTGIERSDIKNILDGDLDEFLNANIHK